MYSAIIGLSRITGDVATNNWRGEPLLPGATPSRAEAAVTTDCHPAMPSPAIADTSDHNTPGHWTSCVFSLMKLYNDESQRNVSNIQYSALLINLSPQFWNNEKNQKCEMRADPSPSSEVWVQFLYKIQNMLIRVVRLRR